MRKDNADTSLAGPFAEGVKGRVSAPDDHASGISLAHGFLRQSNRAWDVPLVGAEDLKLEPRIQARALESHLGNLQGRVAFKRHDHVELLRLAPCGGAFGLD